MGSVASRYLVGIAIGRLFGTNLPFGTLLINVTSSALIGVFVGLFATRGICRKPLASFSPWAYAVVTRHFLLSRLTLGT
jgi:fluoride ion exporter CrcB/FEX